MKYEFIQQHRQQFSVATLCRVLQVSRSGFHDWLTRPVSDRARANVSLLQEIQRVHVEHREAYGAVKTWHTLRQRKIPCGKHRVARLRREAGIQTKRVKRQRITMTVRGRSELTFQLQRCGVGVI